MRFLFVISAVSACSWPPSTGLDDAVEVEAVAPPIEVVMQELPEHPTWPADPDPDYPMVRDDDPALAYLTEEPNRGPWVTEETESTPQDASRTRHVHCEVTPPVIQCSAEVVEADVAAPWEVSRIDGAVVRARRDWLGDDAPATWLWVYDDDGALTRLSSLDVRGDLMVARTFNHDATVYRARARSGANDLDGCGMWRVEVVDGRVAAETCLGWTGTSRLDASGVATRRHRLDTNGFVAETVFEAADGSLVIDKTGAASLVYARDAYGRVTSVGGVGLTGERVRSRLDGCADRSYSYTNSGAVSSTTCRSVNTQVVADGSGVASARFDYHTDGSVQSESYYGAYSTKTTNRMGVHRVAYEVDGRSRMVRQSCFDTEERGTECLPGGADVTVRTYDGDDFREDFQNQWGAASQDSAYGERSMATRFDAVGRKVSIACLTFAHEPSECGRTGYARVESAYDDAGREVSTIFYNAQGLRSANLGTWERRFHYDPYDRLIEVRELSLPGESVSFAAQRFVYGEDGRLSAVLLFDETMHPARFENCFVGVRCPQEAWHAVRLVRDGAGTVTENVYYDADGHEMERMTCDDDKCWQ